MPVLQHLHSLQAAEIFTQLPNHKLDKSPDNPLFAEQQGELANRQFSIEAIISHIKTVVNEVGAG